MTMAMMSWIYLLLPQLQVRDFYLNAGARLGSGFRAWDASVLLARWVYQHAALIKDKVVLEVRPQRSLGSSTGLPGSNIELPVVVAVRWVPVVAACPAWWRASSPPAPT